MPMFRESADERAARKAERDRLINEEARAAILRHKRDWHARTGYPADAGRVNDKGGYGVTVHDDGTVTIGNEEIGDKVETRLPGLHAVLESLEQARDRVTATRLLALGIFAFAVPKRDHRRALVLTGPAGFEAVIVVDGSDEVHLRQWVAWLNRQGAQAAAEGVRDAVPPQGG